MKPSNRKAQEEIGMGIATIGFILILGVFSYYYFVILHGNIARQADIPFAEREYALSTASYLSTLLDFSDEYGIKYPTIIEMAVGSPDAMHPNGKKYSLYFQTGIKPKICSWLDGNLGQNAYYFFVDSGNGPEFTCGVPPQEETTFGETQVLPVPNKKIKTVLVTWPR